MKNLYKNSIEKSLCKKLNIPSLKSGKIIIRDERNWRINEKQIAYCWLINVARSFLGSCFLFSIKFNESNFRDINNTEELIQGLFTIHNNGEINEYFAESRDLEFEDKIKSIDCLELYTANKGITLDGTIYEYTIFAPNTEIRVKLNNPNSDNWRRWEKEINCLGAELSRKIGSIEIQEIFK